MWRWFYRDIRLFEKTKGWQYGSRVYFRSLNHFDEEGQTDKNEDPLYETRVPPGKSMLLKSNVDAKFMGFHELIRTVVTGDNENEGRRAGSSRRR